MLDTILNSDLSTMPAPVKSLVEELADEEAAVLKLAAAVDALTARVAALEEKPAADVSAVAADLKALRVRVLGAGA
jgi:hypothetical protein